MNNDYRILKEDLASMGLTSGDSVLLHSSFKSLGYVEGGISTLVDALLSVLGDKGTLVAPTLTFSSVTEQNPVFDYVNSPSCVGAVSEYIRLMDSSLRSIHPTHSCSVIGARAEDFVRDHDKDRTPVGEHSPFRRLREFGGKILMLGCPYGRNTSMHGVEELFGVSYLLKPVASVYTVILPERTYTIDYRRHNIVGNGYAQRYERVLPLLSDKHLKYGSIHGAQSCLIDADGMWETALNKLKEDETYFVEKTV